MKIIRDLEELKAEFISFFRNETLIPLIGSGFSAGANTKNASVFSGEEYKQFMLEALQKKMNPDYQSKSFSQICDIYEYGDMVNPDFRRNCLINHFTDVQLKQNKRNFLNIGWKYIYTLNFDDGIEKNSEYRNTILANRDVDEKRLNESKCVIKLHGDITDYLNYKDHSCRIFTTVEYKESLIKNNKLLYKLKQDLLYYNFLIIGCSLEDELDLESIQSTPLLDKNPIESNRRFYITSKEPDDSLKATLRKYQITDCIIIKNYDIFYDSIIDFWKESQKFSENDLKKYNPPKIKKLSETDKNAPYFYYCNFLYDIKKNIINIPYYFIDRDLTDSIIHNMDKYAVHLVQGRRLSGKSYFLISLYNKQKKYISYYFDERECINDEVFDRIINEKNSLVLFDTRSISQEQFKKLVNNSHTIHQNRTNVVLMLSNNSSDFLGVLKVNLMKNSEFKDFIYTYTIDNYFTNEELKSINLKLPKSGFPQFRNDKTILSNLIYSADSMRARNRFSNIELECDNYKLLALFIIFATKNTIYSQSLVQYDLTNEMHDVLLKYPYFFEKISPYSFEITNFDNSKEKYVLNSKYWLNRELNRTVHNNDLISDAYEYIINRIFIIYTDELERKQKYKDFILYDVINSIFYEESSKRMKLILSIYERLNTVLSQDFQFLHQYSKSFLMYSYLIDDVEEKIKNLNEAFSKVTIANSMAKNLIEQNPSNENLKISLAHIEFTAMIINCEIYNCGYKPSKLEIPELLDKIYDVINTPYNDMVGISDSGIKSAHSLKSFIQKIYLESNINLLSDSKNKLDKIRAKLGHSND